MTHAPSSDGIGVAVRWIESLMLGSLATVIAVLAIAALGLLMLEGRLDRSQSARAILGCFVIFGAPLIATGLLGTITTAPSVTVRASAEAEVIPPPPPRPPERYDPYAGAALPQGW